MEITFCDGKELSSYKDYLDNPDDRTSKRAFLKLFPKELLKESVKRHSLLKSFETALDYNRVYGPSQNRIELLSGQKDNGSLVMKVRINGSWRKFFNVLIGGSELKKQDWKGQFQEVRNINVIAVNNHDYKGI